MCTKLLWSSYQSAVVSALLYAVVFWGSSINKSALNKINKLIRKAGSVVGVKLDSLEVVAEQRTLNKLLAILDNTSHPLHATLDKQRSSFRSDCYSCAVLKSTV